MCSILRIWSHLLKKSLMENFIFCAFYVYADISLTKIKSMYKTSLSMTDSSFVSFAVEVIDFLCFSFLKGILVSKSFASQFGSYENF